ncbi:MAG: polysaccharide deacetylase family protein [Acidobacteria bacterium]|nr:polysaccharide deacetylase family protein [Acidobacteriota bacterium]
MSSRGPSRSSARRRRPGEPDRARQLRQRRRNAFLLVLVAVIAVVGAIAWSSRDSGGGSSDAPATAQDAPLQVFATAPKPQLPAPKTASIAVTAAGGSGLQMRLVATPRDAAPVTGPWEPGGKALAVPAAIAGATRAGSIPGYVEVRDDSGRTARSSVILLPPDPGPGTAQVVRSGSSSKPYVALVFDDGLDGAGVSRIIDVLRQTKSGGTFCLNGINVKTWTESLTKKVHAAVADGVISLCSHGWGHRTSTTSSEAEATADLSNNATTDRYIGVASVPFYRPPYGALSPGIQKAAGKLGYRWIVLWDVDPSDYQKPDAATLTQRVVSASKNGSIVVLHAIGTTADALPSMIAGLKAKGLKAVTLTTMFRNAATTPGDAAGSTSTTPVVTGGDVPPAPGEGA